MDLLTPDAGVERPETAVLVSVLIPLEDHRDHAERSLRAWCIEQTLDASRYEVIAVASSSTPPRELARIRELLRGHDRLVLTASTDDIGQVADAVVHARGEFLFFSESHVWPEPDVLERCLDRMDARPDWSALICGLQRVAPNRLGDVEADMYERDFASGSTELRWRNINDGGFVTRRAPYDAAGGFDVVLGHFAEWVLAARYATEGFVVGFCPDIVMWHLYPGDLANTRAFTENFVKGEIAYLARGPAARREMLIEAPIEWSCRGDRRRDLAAHLVRMAGGAAAHALLRDRRADSTWRLCLSWLPIAVCGTLLARTAAEVQLLARHVALRVAARFRPKPVLAAAFDGYIAAVIRRARLRWTDHFLARRRPPETGELWSAFPDMGAAAAGLHDGEELGGVTFRWSEPAAVIAIDLSPGRYRIHVNTLRMQLAADRFALPAFFFTAKPIPRERISVDGNVISFDVVVARAGESWLGWICAPASAPGDRRRLGLPLVSILATVAES